MTTRKKEYTAAELAMMPRTARPLAFVPSTDKELAIKYASRVRHGKTKKDHAKRPRVEAAGV